jgi:hypothetical protein
MKRFSIAVILTSLLISTLNAEGMKCGAGKCGGAMKSQRDSGLIHQTKEVDGYKVVLTSKKPLSVGDNLIDVALFKDSKNVDAKVKLKFFMPEMPGMPYMEYKTKGKTKDGVYSSKINFSMGGTWQYQLKFKTDDEKVHKVKGSVNL